MRFQTFVEDPAPLLSCSGFESPVSDTPVMVKKNRVLPFKARLQNQDLQYIDDIGLIYPPVIQVYFSSEVGEATDVTDEALAAGAGSEGNQFEFIDDQWQFNFKTKNYNAAGTYTVEMITGDDAEYVIEPTCSGTFIVGG